LLADSHYFDSKALTHGNLWSAVDVGHMETFARVIELPRLKAAPALAALPLVQRGSRLSVMPVTPAQWEAILALR
jgi:predicted RNA-binding protein with PUA-like domain